jgi:hypothetical protein
MRLAIQLFGFWALAFITLCAALVLLNIFYTLIGNDLTLRSVGQEAALAGVASLIEGASGWLVVSFLPGAVRALFIPALIVAILYKVGHLEDWGRYDILLLFLFQIVLGSSGGFLLFGHFQTALVILGVFGAVLAIIASFARDL